VRYVTLTKPEFKLKNGKPSNFREKYIGAEVEIISTDRHAQGMWEVEAKVDGLVSYIYPRDLKIDNGDLE
jgi:hypothetical protein